MVEEVKKVVEENNSGVQGAKPAEVLSKDVKPVKPLVKEGSEPTKPNVMNKDKSLNKNNGIKRERIALLGFLIVIILFAILFYNWESGQAQKHFVTISDFNFRDGVMLDLPGDSEISFNFNDVNYIAEISVIEGKMNLVLGEINEGLLVGDFGSYDLDGDSEEDLFLRFESFREGSSNIYFREIYEFNCPENWDCTDWGPCINKGMKRVCVDLNTCGTELEKPALVKVC